MFITTTKRIIKAGLLGFYRNRFISLATIFVMTITLFLIGSIFFVQDAVNKTLDQLKNKVDINVYFTTTAPDEKIISIKSAIEKQNEVASVTLKSKEEALADFQDRHQNDALTLQALKELGTNPFGAVLSIKAKETSQYEGIAKFLEGGSPLIQQNPGIIDKINYYQNKVVIDKLNTIIAGINFWGKVVSAIFVLVSAMIIFVTIRLAIFVFRDEISVMRLVGADNWYIRGPFIVEGVLYGIAAAFVTMLVYWPASVWATGHTVSYLAGISFYDFYAQNWFFIFFVLIASGVSLGAISSYLAVRRYLA